MVAPLLRLAVVVLTLLGNVSATITTLPKSEPEFRAAMLRRLHKNGPPDLIAMKKAYNAAAVQGVSTNYTSAGYIASGIYSDSECSKMKFTFGTPVNTCFVDEGFAYMFRLVQNSCVGAVIEYYFDKECTQLAGTSGPSDQITPFPLCVWATPYLYAGTVCSSSSQPWVAQQAIVQELFVGDRCADSVGYMAAPAGLCVGSPGDLDSTTLTCRGSNIVVNKFKTRTLCTKPTGSWPMPSMCSTIYNDPWGPWGLSTADTAGSSLRGDGRERSDASLVAQAQRTMKELNSQIQADDKHAAAAKAHPAAAVDTPVAKRGFTKRHGRPTAASAPVPSMVPAPIPATTPGTTQTDDDVNYYDDDGDDRTYVYDDFVYIYPHDDQDFGLDDSNHYVDFDDFFEPPDEPLAPLDPPPSVSSTPFPTTPAELNLQETARMYCVNSPPKHNAVFRGTQTIEGVTLTQFNSDLPVYKFTVAHTVSNFVLGSILPSVTDIVATDSAASAAATALTTLLLPATFTFRPLSGSGVVVSYKVTVQGATFSTETLAGQLQAAVTDGSFTAHMNWIAAIYGATGLVNATSNSVTTEVLPDDTGDGSSGRKLGTGALIGIVVGGVAALVLLVAAAGYLCSARRSVDGTATMPSDSAPLASNAAAGADAGPSAPAAVVAAVVAVDAPAVEL